MLVDFKNEPVKLFTDPADVDAQKRALEAMKAEYGREYPLIIDGSRIMTDDKLESLDPADYGKVIGYVSAAGEAEAEMAIEKAYNAYDWWRKWTPEARARILFRAAEIMRRRRFEINACMILEEGKNWIEADADTAEAIDFLEFYGREAIRYGQPQPLTRLPGEDNELYYKPLGVGVVISPWNFPNAILVGMSTAALVTGNTVVMKPASDAGVIAAKCFEILEEAGLPEGVLQYCPGRGSKIGDLIVKHPLTRFVSFTGSKEVGLRINELAATHQPGQKWIKRVVAEMGGKDFIVVDSEADLKAAVKSVWTSAFGFQGQKCSACSRLIVVDDVYDEVVAGVAAAAKEIKVGPTKDFSNFMGPVVNKESYEKILNYIEIGKEEGELLAGGGTAGDGGYFIEPTVFGDIKPGARLEQEEIFGPVLACVRAKNFEEAIEIANDTEFGLTGSVYSRKRRRLEFAREEAFVGNLYFNRKCTGALVGAHPFGGFNMSGTDSKAGGRDYLGLFQQAKSVSEVTVC